MLTIHVPSSTLQYAKLMSPRRGVHICRVFFIRPFVTAGEGYARPSRRARAPFAPLRLASNYWPPPLLHHNVKRSYCWANAQTGLVSYGRRGRSWWRASCGLFADERFAGCAPPQMPGEIMSIENTRNRLHVGRGAMTGRTTAHTKAAYAVGKP